MRQPRTLLLGVLVVAMMAVAAQPAAAAESPSQQWITSTGPDITGPGGTMGVTFGASGVTATLTGVSNNSDYWPGGFWPGPDPGLIHPDRPNVTTYLEPDPPAGAPAIGMAVCCASFTTGVSDWSFSKPVIAPILHVHNLDDSYLDVSGTTTTGAAIALTSLAHNNAMAPVGNRLNPVTRQAQFGGCMANDGTNPSAACGSFELGGPGGLVQNFRLTNVEGAFNGVGSGDGWHFTASFPTAPLTKQFVPARIPVNGTSQLTFTIANPDTPSQADLSPLDFTDVLPANVTLANGDWDDNENCGSPTVTGAGGAALAGGGNTVAAGNISVAAGATCTITVNVTSSTPTEPGPPYLNDNGNLSTTVANLIPNASTTLAVYPVADVRVEKSTDGPVVPGEEVTYELLVTNDGPSTATNEVVSDPLPSGLSFVSASPECTEAGGTVTCAIASLAANTSTTFTVTARAAASADCENDLVNTASVSGNTNDPNMGNNSSTVRNCERRSDLRITKDPSSAQVATGGQVMYTVVVENLGPSDNPNVTVSDPMATGLSLVSADPSQGTCSTTGPVSCNLGNLKAGGSAQILVTATMTAAGAVGAGASCDPPANIIINTVTVSGDAFDPNPDNNRDDAQVCPTPNPTPRFDLVTTKTANDRSLVIGQRVTYRIEVTNNGPDAAPNAIETDTLNAQVNVVSVKSTQGSCPKAIPMRCELGTIAAGASVTITIVAKHKKAGCKQRQAASATGAGTDTNPANNMDTVDVCVKKVRLKLSKVASRSSVAAGDTLSYRIRVRNPTKGEARKVKVCDRLPSGLSYVSSNPDAKRQGARQHCWTIKLLKAGKSRTFGVTVRAAKGAIGRKVNTATLSSPDINKRLRAKDPVRVRGIQTPLTG